MGKNNPIRLVHLLEHTAGWQDTKLAEATYPDSADLTLATALSLFAKNRTSRWVPGSRFSYSNIGSAIAARIVEKVTGTTFASYVQQHWFNRLNMPTATFFQPENETLATPYMQQQAQPYWHLPYRPAGSINSSAKELLNLVHFLLKRGEFDHQTLLSQSSIDRMELPMSNLGTSAGITDGTLWQIIPVDINR